MEEERKRKKLSPFTENVNFSAFADYWFIARVADSSGTPSTFPVLFAPLSTIQLNASWGSHFSGLLALEHWDYYEDYPDYSKYNHCADYSSCGIKRGYDCIEECVCFGCVDAGFQGSKYINHNTQEQCKANNCIDNSKISFFVIHSFHFHSLQSLNKLQTIYRITYI